MKRFWIYPLVLFAIAVLDLTITSIGLHFKVIEEMNPIAVKIIELGDIPLLIIWKLSLTVCGISVLEFMWRGNLLSKQVVKNAYLIGILSYVTIFTVGIALFNFV